MNISKNGKDLIKKFEGCELVAYKCPRGIWTIGYGHTGPDVVKGKVITQKQAEETLDYDLIKFCKGISSLIKVNVTQNQFDAIASLTFNIGIGAFGSSTLLRLLNEGRYTEAAQQFDRWVYVEKEKSDGLIRRRKIEKELFLK